MTGPARTMRPGPGGVRRKCAPTRRPCTRNCSRPPPAASWSSTGRGWSRSSTAGRKRCSAAAGATSSGKPFGALVAEHPGEADAALLAAGSDHPVELVLRRANGEELTVEAITSRPAQVRAGLVVIALRDVTGRKRKEEALRARSRQQALVAELGRRALTGHRPRPADGRGRERPRLGPRGRVRQPPRTPPGRPGGLPRRGRLAGGPRGRNDGGTAGGHAGRPGDPGPGADPHRGPPDRRPLHRAVRGPRARGREQPHRPHLRPDPPARRPGRPHGPARGRSPKRTSTSSRRWRTWSRS